MQISIRLEYPKPLWWQVPTLLAQVRSQVEADNYGKIVAIDIETGAFEVADDSLTAAKQLLVLPPDAQIFGIRIGHRAVHRFGFRAPGVSG